MSETSTDVVWLTQEAYDKLEAELTDLKTVGRPDVSARIAAAREEGDLSENGGYHAAREEQGQMEGRIRQLEDLLRRAQVGEPEGARDEVAPGKVITVAYDGKTWESLIPFNVQKPGVSGWREQSAEGGRAAWVQPTGAHDAYPIDAEVTHKGRAWLNTYPSNAYEPGVYGWTDLGPA